MSEIYPKINEGAMKQSESEAFRLQKVNEINSYFEKEIEEQRKLLNKYKRAYTIIDGLNYTSSIGSAALGIGTIGLVSFTILPPVAISLEGIAIGICVSSIIFNILHKRFMHKIKKHEEIIGCAKAKLTTVHVIYSKALEDGKIDHDEFKKLLSEKDIYIKLKNDIRQKSLDAEQKINVEEIKKEFLEKGKQLGKNEMMEKLKCSV